MNNLKSLVIVALVALLAGGALGYSLKSTTTSSVVQPLGALTVPANSTTTHGTAGQSALLYGWEFNVAESLGNLNSRATALRFSSSSCVIPTLATSGVAIIRQAMSGATPGDFVVPRVNATATDLMRLTVNGSVSAANEVSLLFTSNPTGTFGWVGGTVPCGFAVYPSSTWGSAATIDISTTTTPYNN